MSRFFTIILVLAFCFDGYGQSPTSPALGFNVFLENNARLINNETEGPMALGGNLSVEAGYQVATHSAGSFATGGRNIGLLIGGSVSYVSGVLQINSNGYIKIGNCVGSHVWYTDENGAFSPIRITPGTIYNASSRINLQANALTLGVSASSNQVCQGGLINFSSAFTNMRRYADTMKTLVDNAYLTNSGGTVIAHTGLPSQVKITLNPGLNVLNISGTDLNAVSDFVYNNSPSASRYLVINVNTPSTFTWNVYNSAGIGFTQCPYIIYNFYNATTLNIAGSGAVEGTIFAPRADIVKTTNMSNIEGQVIAQSFRHAGGEVHYAIFSPSIPGCSPATATSANFVISSSNQCLSGNLFGFTNTSSAVAPVMYNWQFGDGSTSTLANPVKTYSTPGTYTVKLKVTGAGGADSTTRSVIVSPTPVSGYSVNDSIQSLTGNSFTFTSTTPTTGNTYTWLLGDGSSNTLTNPTKTYGSAGVYNVTQIISSTTGCTVKTIKSVVVETDSVGSGSDGGLESERLGGLVSQRAYAKVKNNVSKHIDYSKCPEYTYKAASAAAKGTAYNSMSKYIPAQYDGNTVQRITSPEDLKNITTAVDVLSVDYTQNDVAKAVVLGILTLGKPYNHTKSICDRLRGAELIDVRVVTINGLEFIQFALKQNNESIEHCIAFAVGKSNGVDSFHLQSKWLLSQYTNDDSVFNFQVWSSSPEGTQRLTKDLLNNLSAQMPLTQIDNHVALPSIYMSKGTRNKEMLDVKMHTETNSYNAKFIFFRRLNEIVTATDDSLIIPLSLTVGTDNLFHIPIYDGYEYEGHLYVNDTLVDNVYLADGNWSLDYDKNYTQIVSYTPANNPNRIYAADEYPVYRSVQVSAKTNDYISVYKFIQSGQEAVDLTTYNSYKFFAKGSGKMTIRLIKSSVSRFADQYKTNVELEPGGQQYQISFDDFFADGTQAPFDASDVRAVVYTFEMNGTPTDFNFFADEQAFSPTKVPSIKELSSKSISISPNPTNGKFQLTFGSEETREMEINVMDLSGRIVYKQPISAKRGFNTYNIELPAGLKQSVMLVQVGNNAVRYSTTKVGLLK